MAKTSLQVMGWLISMCSWGATVGVFLSHKWKSTSVEGLPVLDSVTYMEGLWDSCEVYPTGQRKCITFSGPLSSQPNVVVTCRILLMIAILLGVVCGFVTLLAFKCTDIGPEDRKSEARVAFWTGLGFLACGFCVTIASAYYMHDIVRGTSLLNRTTNLPPYQIHEALKIAMAFGLLWLIGGLVQLCGSHHIEENDVKYEHDKYNRNMRQEYI
ncbi:claudin-7-like [Clavelina lepadiformis]|uniref:Claudin n=1 Tax=Clavelina lepadiformis TaxID=159417 RepID=A0ABP0FBC4_CLALP